MKRTEMKAEFRAALLSTPQLRHDIAADLMLHESTIKRWALNNNPSLAQTPFLNSFKKHTKSTGILTEDVEINAKHLHE